MAWSVEVRRSVGETFSPVADFFKANTVAIVASEEKDVIGLRSNVQKATVYLFRLDIDQDRQREILEQYVNKANALAKEPEFFNSVFTNCSMSVVRLARAAGAEVMLDWRLIVNGYMPNYFYDRGTISTEMPLEDIYRLGDISERAQDIGLTGAFSTAIREGVPIPR